VVEGGVEVITAFIGTVRPGAIIRFQGGIGAARIVASRDQSRQRGYVIIRFEKLDAEGRPLTREGQSWIGHHSRVVEVLNA
jgi:hypothetical protein